MNEQFSALEILRKSSTFLSKKGIKSAKIDAEWIICNFLKIKKLDIYLDKHVISDEETLNKIRHAISRRAKREPLQHILGYVEFHGIMLKCDKRALIPRFETEQLVDLISSNLPVGFQGSILDFGTGSGAIIISLAKIYPHAKCLGIDKSVNCISLAKENVILNKCDQHVDIIQYDWNNSSIYLDRVNVIVANPPYLSEKEWLDTEPEVKEHDPKDALLSRKEGIYDLEKIIDIAPSLLCKSGLLALEIGHNQSEYLLKMLNKHFRKSFIKKDFTGKRRFLLAML